MIFEHAVVWIDHAAARVLHFEDQSFPVRSFRKSIRLQAPGPEGPELAEKFMGAVCEALGDTPQVLLTGTPEALAAFERHGVAAVRGVADAVQPEQLARHLEPGHLVAAVLARHRGLEEAAAHGVDRRERLAAPEQRLAPAYLAPGRRERVEAVEVGGRESDRQAKAPQVAVRTGDGLRRRLDVAAVWREGDGIDGTHGS